MPEAAPRVARDFVKRGIDIVGALLALVFVSPILAVLTLIMLGSQGWPILHRETRIGQGGDPFGVLKLRTLYTSADDSRKVAPEDNPRITPLGRWLRRWRLDELPQLINVLAGQMSLVGPRPIPPEHAATLPDDVRAELFALRPGLTDPAALRFLAEDAVLAGQADAESTYLQMILPAKVQVQLAYSRRQSLLADLKVLGTTLLLVWSRGQRHRSAREIEQLLK